jgi:hypothetical protein
MIEVIVTGGRDYKNYEFVCEKLNELHKLHTISLLIQGGATGADHLAFVWAMENNVPYETVNAEWERLGLSAGMQRNYEMITSYPNAWVVAFKGGKGTDGCVAIARSHNREVIDYRRHG